MALLNASPGPPGFDLSGFDLGLFTNVTLASPASFRLNFSDGSYWAVSGSDFLFGGGDGLPFEGTVTAVDFFRPTDVEVGSLVNVAVGASSLSQEISADGAAGALDLLLATADTIAGNDSNDDLRGAAAGDLIIGRDGPDILYGEDANDLLVAGVPASANGDNDTAFGGAGDDVIAGAIGADTLYGDAGNDWIDSGTDSDRLFGAAGDDALIGGSEADTLYGGAGDDYQSGGAGLDWLQGDDGNDRLEGGGDGDIIFGNEGADVILGGDGNDFMGGGNDADFADGGGGADYISGDAGNDILEGDGPFPTSAAGNDTLFGGDDADLVLGNGGDDRLYGDAGQDTLVGEAGRDTLRGSSDNDILFGGDDADLLQGEDDADTLFGGGGIDELFGGNGADTLNGDAGDDQLGGGPGSDVLNGGEGDDTVTFASDVTILGTSGDTVTVFGPDGVDTLISVERIVVPETIDLATLTPAQGFIILGDDIHDQAGGSVATAGDVNGDGFDDLLLGARYNSDNGFRAGAAYVVFGSAAGFASLTSDASGRHLLDLSSLDSAHGFILRGEHAYDYAGRGVAAAGDVNGDGYADLIVGALGSDGGGSVAGAAYVLLGGASGPTQGFVIQGDASGDYAGLSVSGAGDINGDGFDDLVVGAPGGDDGGDRAGEAYVIFGAAAAPALIDLTSLSSSRGFIIQGDDESDRAGFSVSSAGDVNGDGFDDVLVGAPLSYAGGHNSGEAYVVFGDAGGFGTNVGGRQVVDITSLSTAQGFIIRGDEDNAAGQSVASAGDINGDGFDDLLIGAPQASEGGLAAGDAFVVLGTASGFGTLVTVAGVAQRIIDVTSLDPTQGFVVQGSHDFEQAGVSVGRAGDINGDGFDDLIVGASGTDSGSVFVIFGKSVGFGAVITVDGVVRRVIDLAHLDKADGFAIDGAYNDGDIADSVSGAGDINGDGFDDLIVGSPRNSLDGTNTGAAYVLFGAPFGTAVGLSITGSAGNDLLIGDAGADTLIGAGGIDVFRGGAGNDLIVLPTAAFADIDGGTGTDTLALTGNGQTLALGNILPAKLHSIEHVDLTGGGNNTLTSDPLAFLDITEARGVGVPALSIEGNTGDKVQLSDGGGSWSQLGTIASGSVTYDRWIWDPDGAGPLPATTHAELWIDVEVATVFL